MSKGHSTENPKGPEKEIPPGATRSAFDRPDESRTGGGGGGTEDIYAAGTPAGGTEVGGLGGTNIGDGDPDNADLENRMGGEVEDEESGPPYSGRSGGAVGGTPAEGRSSGGNIHRGIDPGGVHRGDSTVGSDPEEKRG